jgi:hypothetical protein
MSGSREHSTLPGSTHDVDEEAEDVSLLIATEGGGANEGGRGGGTEGEANTLGGVREGLNGNTSSGTVIIVGGVTDSVRSTEEGGCFGETAIQVTDDHQVNNKEEGHIEEARRSEKEEEAENSSDEDDDLTSEQLLLLHSRHGNVDKVKHLLQKHGDSQLNINCKGKQAIDCHFH